MVKLIVGGFVLVLLGLGGVASACQTGAEDSDLLMSVVSGLAVAMGLALIGIGGMRRGYHYRPHGSPPGDMDPDKAFAPTPKEPPRPVYQPRGPQDGRVDR